MFQDNFAVVRSLDVIRDQLIVGAAAIVGFVVAEADEAEPVVPEDAYARTEIVYEVSGFNEVMLNGVFAVTGVSMKLPLPTRY